MFKSRQLVFSTLIFALLPPFLLSGAASAVEYVGGTVKSIPANSTGAFNFDDAKELRFNYGGSVYALPYEQITSTDIGRVKGESHHILRKIPVPSFSRPSPGDPDHHLQGCRRRHRHTEFRAYGASSVSGPRQHRDEESCHRVRIEGRDRMTDGGATNTGRRIATGPGGKVKARRRSARRARRPPPRRKYQDSQFSPDLGLRRHG